MITSPISTDWLEASGHVAPASVDLLYVDPPFNTGVTQTAVSGAFQDAWLSTEDFLAWLRKRLEATVPLLKPSACVLVHLDWRTSHRARCVLDELLGEDRFVNHLVWKYGLGGSSRRRFARKHDDILFYCVDPQRHYFEPPMVPATSRRMAGKLKKADDVLDIPAINNMARERVGYPTQKPLALLQLLIRACCPEDGLVLDPCCGSGTTLVAAKKLGRRSVGMDINPEAVAIAQRRLDAIGEPAQDKDNTKEDNTKEDPRLPR